MLGNALDHKCDFDNILLKIMKLKSFTANEISYISNILNWAKEERCPFIFDSKEEETKQEKEAEFSPDNITNIQRKLVFESGLLSSEKTMATKGKILGENGVASVRARNLEITYSPSVDCEEAKGKIKDGIEPTTINRTGESSFRVYRNSRIYIKDIKKLEVDGKAPIIRTFSYDMLKGNLMNGAKNIEAGAIAVSEFLKEMNSETKKRMESVLKEALENLRILYYSEYVLSCVFFGFLSAFGTKTNWKNLKIFSIDTKMEEWKIEKKVENFRCDLVVFFNDDLFVIEFKFKYNRPENMGKAAIDCIHDKKYASRVSKFIQVNYPNEFAKLKRICLVGVGYVLLESKIRCDVEYSVGELEHLSQEELEKEVKRIKKVRERTRFLKKKRKNIGEKMEEEEE